MSTTSLSDFEKLDFRVGTIVSAKKQDWSEKLIKMEVDFGKLGRKQVFSGIRPWYRPEELVGKQAVFLVNLPPREIHGQLSEVMILTAEDINTKSFYIVTPQKRTENGARVY